MVMRLSRPTIAALLAVPLGVSAFAVAGTGKAEAITCSTGYMCIYKNSNYGPQPAGLYKGSNSNWVNDFNGDWNDVVSSSYNNQIGYENELFQDINFENFTECIEARSDTKYTANFENISTGSFSWDTFNDAASSDWVFRPIDGPLKSCDHVD
jgi:hypothetical protein